MRMYDVIEKKQRGLPLTEHEITFFVEGYTTGIIPDYQVSALLMAIYFQGMSIDESAMLTMAMVHSGETVDLSGISGIKVDKHSTGGVGDTTTLILAPLVAACGVPVAKMSGRGLGHTGGTIDKLEAVAGFHVEISNEEFIKLVNRNNIAIIGQSEKLVPADKLLYSLRDVTSTVDSIPLIASSIMSKKIASGADAIVLDVKTGAGAFMKRYEDAKQLAETMVAIGERVGKKTVAILTYMEQPLGHAVGNALEIKEAIDTLQGNGPKDLTELSIELASHMLVLAKNKETMEAARSLIHEKIVSGDALQCFKQFIQAQGGDASVVDDPDKLPQPNETEEIYAEKTGYVTELVADDIGKAALLLGAGRETKASEIDLAVGVIVHKKLGDHVEKGETLFTLYLNKGQPEEAKRFLKKSIRITQEQKSPPLILETVVHASDLK